MTEMAEVEVIVIDFSPFKDAVFVKHDDRNFHLPHSQIQDYDEVALLEAELDGKPITLCFPLWLAKREYCC